MAIFHGDHRKQEGMKKLRLSTNISLYLRNDAR